MNGSELKSNIIIARRRRFISVYETPSKIILRVYVALLRSYNNDARELSRIALDILLPALPLRLNTTEFIKATKWTKKVSE